MNHLRIPTVNRRRLRKPPRPAARAGAACVEFAFVLPLIVFLFLGAIELTRLNFLSHTAMNAAYEGARQAIVPGGTTADARDETLRLMNVVDAGNGTLANVEQFPDRVRVTVSIPVHLNSWGLGRFTSNMTISRTCTLTRETVDTSL